MKICRILRGLFQIYEMMIWLRRLLERNAGKNYGN